MARHYGATFTFGAMEWCHVKGIRRTIVENGGIFREFYAYPGVSWDASFRSFEERRACCEAIAFIENPGLREDEQQFAIKPQHYIDEYYRVGRPVDHFEVVNAIKSPTTRRYLTNPLKEA